MSLVKGHQGDKGLKHMNYEERQGELIQEKQGSGGNLTAAFHLNLLFSGCLIKICSDLACACVCSLLSPPIYMVPHHIYHKWFYKNNICGNSHVGLWVWDYFAVKFYFLFCCDIKIELVDSLRVIPIYFVKTKHRSVHIYIDCC